MHTTENKPIPFLAAVARAVLSQTERLSDYCFVFPNKRSGSFFLKNLSEQLGNRMMMAPEVYGISDFMAKVAHREPASRIDSLFRLYKIYRTIRGRSENISTEEDLLDFDRFAPWGETLLNDFSEVDKYDVDAEAIFSNVKDYREISSNFLTEEQIELIERYFGYTPQMESVEGFWRSVDIEHDQTELRQRFIELWSIMPELYSALQASLDQDGLALEGGMFRLAMQRVQESGREVLPWRHIVVVGFNMLSTTEYKLFGELQKMLADDGVPYVDFFWDAMGPVLTSGDGNGAKGMRRNMKNFPMPEWARPFIEMCNPGNKMPQIEIAASPSNAAQVKIAGAKVKDWLNDARSEEGLKDARAAIIVPDENLLLPLVHSLPPELEAVNITMGYSMRYTSLSSFMFHLRRLQTRRRKWGDEYGYYFEDLKLMLSHPLTHVIIGSDKAAALNTYISKYHKRVVRLSEIAELSPEAGELFYMIPSDADVHTVISYVDMVLEMLSKSLYSAEQSMRVVNKKIERSQIDIYRMALVRLQQCVEKHGVEMRFNSVFHLVDRLISGETVNFEGEPLQGLQVMGLLETRAVDFDRVLVLSMNDKVMPRRSARRTFVPDSLRRGYGMPTVSQNEDLFSYYFYRLISRAQEVTLIYDARAGEGMRSGGKSRFLLQLELLYARDQLRNLNYTFRLDPPSAELKPVDKGESVMAMLDDFKRKEGGRNLSASALMDYCSCPVKFYYKDVVGIKDSTEPGDAVDPITVGNILHGAMMEIYVPQRRDRRRYLENRIVVTASLIDSLLADEQKLAKVVRQNVNREHFHLPDDQLDAELPEGVAIVADRIVGQLADVLKHDRELTPFELVGVEIKGNCRFRFGNSEEVNFSYAFDRVDYRDGRYRVVDYKTGSAHVEAPEFENIFDGTPAAKYFIQLLLYAHLLEDKLQREGRPTREGIAMVIYDVNEILHSETIPKIDKSKVQSHLDVTEQFRERMEQMINEIFDADIPFKPAENPDRCAYCNLRALCGRE